MTKRPFSTASSIWAVALIGGLSGGISGPVLAAELVASGRVAIDAEAGLRLEAGDRLRLLSQEVAASACHFAGGIMPDESRRTLAEAKSDFDAILQALRYGDADLNILDEEYDDLVLNDLDVLESEWRITEAAVRRVIDDPDDLDALDVIEAESNALYESSDTLVSGLRSLYSRPVAPSETGSTTDDLVMYQMILTQKLAKQACQIWSGMATDWDLKTFGDHSAHFDQGLRILLEGGLDGAVPPAPTPEIRSGLDRVLGEWDVVQAQFVQVTEGTIDAAGKEELYKRLIQKLSDFERLAGLYGIALR